ncbi:unnamed protein product [Prorocentrum cordatum]|uniref:Decapping nuclease n=1 Tax=Prorocentrum cordatum TaxID=2364126 RepID=A0ABN9TVR5_9DINO|nr:unnamed protein product [Polarella glacialis]
MADEEHDFEMDVTLAVDDQTRHWLYFQRERTEAERAASLHKTDVGGASVIVKQKIRDGRGKNFKLDETSFELIDAPTSLSTDDFYAMSKNPTLVEKYRVEVAELVKKKLKCDVVHCFHHQVRCAPKAALSDGSIAGYAGGGPHTDSSAISGDQLALSTVAQIERANPANAGPFKRYLYLNLWRNISDEPIENDHLAVLDERTVAKPDDYIVKDLYGPGYELVQYGLNARHKDHHRWYYFPKMTKNEGILFKQVDSDFTLAGRTCFHMSARNPGVQEKHPRESIELRMMCFWREAAVDSMPTEANVRQELIQTKTAGPLEDAGLWTLGRAFLSRLLGLALFGRGGASSGQAYGGDPKPYAAKLIAAVEALPKWPAAGRQWASQVVTSQGLEQGIVTITHTLAEDKTGHFGTKHFSKEVQQVIAEAALGDEKYMETARKAIGNLADN